MKPTWGPSRADRTQVGRMLVQWTLLSGIAYVDVIINPSFEFKAALEESVAKCDPKGGIRLRVIAQKSIHICQIITSIFWFSHAFMAINVIYDKSCQLMIVVSSERKSQTIRKGLMISRRLGKIKSREFLILGELSMTNWLHVQGIGHHKVTVP